MPGEAALLISAAISTIFIMLLSKLAPRHYLVFAVTWNMFRMRQFPIMSLYLDDGSRSKQTPSNVDPLATLQLISSITSSSYSSVAQIQQITIRAWRRSWSYCAKRWLWLDSQCKYMRIHHWVGIWPIVSTQLWSNVVRYFKNCLTAFTVTTRVSFQHSFVICGVVSGGVGMIWTDRPRRYMRSCLLIEFCFAGA
jgi:hypothetical protein